MDIAQNPRVLDQAATREKFRPESPTAHYSRHLRFEFGYYDAYYCARKSVSLIRQEFTRASKLDAVIS